MKEGDSVWVGRIWVINWWPYQLTICAGNVLLWPKRSSMGDHSVAKDKTNIWKWKWSAMMWWISWLSLSILFNNTVLMLSQINYNFDASMIIEWKLHVTFSSSSFPLSPFFHHHNAFLRGGVYLVGNSIINGPHSHTFLLLCIHIL